MKKVSELLYRSRFTQVFSAAGLAAAGEAIEFRITAYLGYFIIQPVTSQHTEMPMVIGPAAAFCIGSHVDLPGKDVRLLKVPLPYQNSLKKKMLV